VRLATLLLLTLLAPAAAGEDMEMTPAQKLVSANRVLVIAHRGASAVAPENTLPAFEKANEIGVDLVELDYYHTSDGRPVVFHDKDLKRTTNALAVLGNDALGIGQITFEQSQKLDVGAWFGPQFRGARMPTLEESLDVIQSRSTTLVERKEGDAATCVALLERKQLLDHVVVQAFDWDFLTDCRRLAPNLVLGALGDKEITPQKLSDLDRLDVQAVGWNHKSLTQESIAALRSRGRKVWAYTVDDSNRAQELFDAGIDGIITNDPEKIKAILPRP
jgi:glycerophosphoryl diester phosphodiesterase